MTSVKDYNTIDKIYDSICIRVGKLTDQEIRLKYSLSKGKAVLNKITIPKHIDWDLFNSIRMHVSSELEKYDGRFKNYFQEKLDYLKKEEKRIAVS